MKGPGIITPASSIPDGDGIRREGDGTIVDPTDTITGDKDFIRGGFHR